MVIMNNLYQHKIEGEILEDVLTIFDQEPLLKDVKNLEGLTLTYQSEQKSPVLEYDRTTNIHSHGLLKIKLYDVCLRSNQKVILESKLLQKTIYLKSLSEYEGLQKLWKRDEVSDIRYNILVADSLYFIIEALL